LEKARATPVGRLLEALGVVFETRSFAEAALDSSEDSLAPRSVLIVSEEQLASADSGRARVKELLHRYRHILIYPFQGTPEGLRSLSACVDGRAEVKHLSIDDDSRYFIETNFAAAGPFAGLKIGAVDTTTDCQLIIRDSPHPVENIVSIGGRSVFTRITFPSTELFVLSSTAVFDVEAE